MSTSLTPMSKSNVTTYNACKFLYKHIITSYDIKHFPIKTYVLVSVSPLASIVHACAKHQDVWLAPPRSCPLPVWPLETPPHSRAPSNHEERCHQTAGPAPELQSESFQLTTRTTDTKALKAQILPLQMPMSALCNTSLQWPFFQYFLQDCLHIKT